MMQYEHRGGVWRTQQPNKRIPASNEDTAPASVIWNNRISSHNIRHIFIGTSLFGTTCVGTETASPRCCVLKDGKIERWRGAPSGQSKLGRSCPCQSWRLIAHLHQKSHAAARVSRGASSPTCTKKAMQLPVSVVAPHRPPAPKRPYSSTHKS